MNWPALLSANMPFHTLVNWKFVTSNFLTFLTKLENFVAKARRVLEDLKPASLSFNV